MARFVTNPRRRNGALNQLIAKKLGVNIRTEAGRKAVKAFKQSAGYKLGGSMGDALAKARSAKKKRTAESKAYTKKTGMSRAAAFYQSVGAKKKAKRGGRRAAAAAPAAAAPAAAAAKRGGKKATASASGVMYTSKGQPYIKTADGKTKFISKEAAAKMGAAGAPAAKKASGKGKAPAAKVSAAEAAKGKRGGKRGGKRKASSRKKNPYGFFRRRNGAVQDTVGYFRENVLSMQGITTLVLAGAAGAAHYYLAPMVDEQVTKLPVVGEYLGYAPYTITGAAASAVVFGLGRLAGAGRFTDKVALAALLGGPVLDVVDFFRSRASGSSDMGSIVYNGLGNIAVTTNPAYGEIAVMERANPGYGADTETAPMILEYGDAQGADAYLSGEDFDDLEGDALIRGPRAFFARFGPPPRVASRVQGSYSRHAGRQGHRWGWLIKLVGFQKAAEIASLPPAARLQVIEALRRQALASLPAIMSQQAALPAPSAYTTMMSDAQAAGGPVGYGGVFASGVPA